MSYDTVEKHDRYLSRIPGKVHSVGRYIPIINNNYTIILKSLKYVFRILAFLYIGTKY